MGCLLVISTHIKDNSSHISLSESSLGNIESEETIEEWYKESLLQLQSSQQRDEQYRRKRAMLRVEYWTKMDKLRNNATPTVINF